MAYQFSSSKDKKTSAAKTPAAAKNSGDESGQLRFRGLMTLILIVIIVGGGFYLLTGGAGLNGGGIYNRLSADYQAVFLDNGQVYFGSIVQVDDRNVVLQDIYYLQVVNAPLQRSQQEAAVDANQPSQSDQRLRLIKLGNEIHGPRDEMIINRDHVLLMEDLKDDSGVVEAIDAYLNGETQN